MSKPYKYDQDEAHALNMFATKLERAARNWKGRWANQANQRVMDDFIHVATSIRLCVSNDQMFTPGIMVQMQLPNFEDDDSEYADEPPFPF
jgi:hypothetical protein